MPLVPFADALWGSFGRESTERRKLMKKETAKEGWAQNVRVIGRRGLGGYL